MDLNKYPQKVQQHNAIPLLLTHFFASVYFYTGGNGTVTKL